MTEREIDKERGRRTHKERDDHKRANVNHKNPHTQHCQSGTRRLRERARARDKAREHESERGKDREREGERERERGRKRERETHPPKSQWQP